MRTRIIFIKVVLLVLFVGFSPVYAQNGENILVNGGFEDGVIAPWTTNGNATFEVVTDDPVEGDYCLMADLPTAGANFWDVFFKYQDLVFEQGKHYTFAAFLKSDVGDRQIMLKPELNQDPYTGYAATTFTITTEWQEYYVTTDVFNANVTPADVVFLMAYQAGTIWIDNVRFFEGDYVPPVIAKKTSALNPEPEDGSTEAELNTILSWTPGIYADTHDVFFGTNFDDVDQSTIDAPLGDTIVSQGQAVDANTFDPGMLEYETTYYWRVDEVNAPGDDTVFKGTVWSFTAELYSYPVNPIYVTVTADSNSADNGIEAVTYTADDTNGVTDDIVSIINQDQSVSTGPLSMWRSESEVDGEAWIQYTLDKPRKLDKMLIWNFNGTGFNAYVGIKDATIEYLTVDDPNWILLGDYVLTKAPGKNTYTTPDEIDFDGKIVIAVKITANSNFFNSTSIGYGLSEVRLYEIPTYARVISPEDGSVDVDYITTLKWKPGRDMVDQTLYVDSDINNVMNALIPGITGTITEYPNDWNLNQTYYWRVDENDVNNLWIGYVWSFTTQGYLILDDFESYEENDANAVWVTWKDGFNNDENGSQMGHSGPYNETEIVQEGDQSAALYYDNSTTANISEVTLEFDTVQNLAHHGADALRLFYYGQPGPFTVSGNSIAMSGGGSDLYTTTEQHHFAYKTLTGDGSIAVRLDSMGGGGTYPKAGIMIRSGLEDGAPLASLFREAFGEGSAYFRNRTTQDGSLANAAGASLNAENAAMPLWLKLTRSGTTIIAETSDDGITWVPFSNTGTSPTTATISMADEVCIGLFISSNSTTNATGAIFSDVNTTGTVTGNWTEVDFGQNIEPVNTLDTMYIVLTDSGNNTAKVEAPELAAFTMSWTEWLIPYEDFVGVDMTKVKEITIGVGDAANPLKGKGLVYIDNISYGHPSE